MGKGGRANGEHPYASVCVCVTYYGKVGFWGIGEEHTGETLLLLCVCVVPLHCFCGPTSFSMGPPASRGPRMHLTLPHLPAFPPQGVSVLPRLDLHGIAPAASAQQGPANHACDGAEPPPNDADHACDGSNTASNDAEPTKRCTPKLQRPWQPSGQPPGTHL